MYSLIFFVNFPVQMINNPEARGSSVPACPTFFMRIRLRIFLTASNDVQCKGLSISNTCPSSKLFIMQDKSERPEVGKSESGRVCRQKVFLSPGLSDFRTSRLTDYIDILVFNSRYLFTVFTVRFSGVVRMESIPFL